MHTVPHWLQKNKKILLIASVFLGTWKWQPIEILAAFFFHYGSTRLSKQSLKKKLPLFLAFRKEKNFRKTKIYFTGANSFFFHSLDFCERFKKCLYWWKVHKKVQFLKYLIIRLFLNLAVGKWQAVWLRTLSRLWQLPAQRVTVTRNSTRTHTPTIQYPHRPTRMSRRKAFLASRDRAHS